MTVSIGSFTVGTGGGQDYANFGDAVDDIASPLTGNLTFTQTSDTTESNGWSHGFGLEIDTGGFKLLLTTDTPHKGQVGVGHICSVTNHANAMWFDGTSGGTYEVAGLQFKNISGAAAQTMVVDARSGTDVTILLHDITIDGNGAAFAFEWLIVRSSSSSSIQIDNILHVDADSSVGSACFRIDNNDTTGSVKFNNCVVNAKGAGIGVLLADFPSGQTHEFHNLISMTVGGTAFSYAGTDGASIPANYMESCASDDATATGGTDAIINFTPTTEFKSLIKGNINYLVPKMLSQFKLAGAAVANTTDMKGNTYGASPPVGGFIAFAEVSTAAQANYGAGFGLGLGLGLGLGAGEGYSYNSRPSVVMMTLNIKVKTDNVGSSNDDQFTLRLDGVSTYNFDWKTSDGQSGTHTVNTDLTFTFPAAGTFTIKLGGTNNTLPTIFFNGLDDVLKVLEIMNYGNIVIATLNKSWVGCSNMDITASDAPDVASCIRFTSGFQNTGITSFSFNGWDCTAASLMDSFLRDGSLLTSVDMTGGDLSTITNLFRFIKGCPLVTTITGLTSAGMTPVTMQSFADGATLYDQDLSGMDFSALTSGVNALIGTSFSTANWDLLIVSLAAQTLISGGTWHAGNANYTEGAVDSGTTDGATTAFKLIQSGQNFLTTVSVNEIIHNTANDTYAKVTNVDSDSQLTISVDIMSTGETYVVQGSAVAKDRFTLIDSDLWVLTDNGPV